MVITEEVIKLLFDTGGTIEETDGGALEEFSESCIVSIEEGVSWDTLEELLIGVAVDTILGGEDVGGGKLFPPCREEDCFDILGRKTLFGMGGGGGLGWGGLGGGGCAGEEGTRQIVETSGLQSGLLFTGGGSRGKLSKSNQSKEFEGDKDTG